jgi:DNA-binding MarR family transcriptional regulator
LRSASSRRTQIDLLLKNAVSTVRTIETFGVPVVHSTVNVASGQGPTLPELAGLLAEDKPLDRASRHRAGAQLRLESSSDRYLWSMSEAAHQGAGKLPVKWLTAAEVDSWLSVVRLMTWLPWSIDQQLQRDSNLGMVEYQVLAMLSNRPERTMRMSSLAEVTNASLSRLSHLVKRLEGRGLVRREPDPADGRFTNAILTDAGFQTLADAAPGHVAHVRSLVIDVLSPEQLRRLGLTADRIMSHIDTSGIN